MKLPLYKIYILKITKEFKIGFIVLVALGLLYWGFSFLKGEDVFSKERVYIAVYNNVGGLGKANPVFINGLRVGQVRDMYFRSEVSSEVVVVMIITNPLPIPDNSVANIFDADLLGSKAIEISLGNSRVYAESGDTLIASKGISLKEEVSKQLEPLRDKMENLILSIDTMLVGLNHLFDKSNTANISKSVESIARTFENLERTTATLDTLMIGQKKRIEGILQNTESITRNLAENQDRFNHIMANFSALSDSLAQSNFKSTVNSANDAMLEVANIVKRINEGEGSLGLLVNDDSLYIELEKSSRDLNLLLEDIKNNPKKYLKFSVF
ncbi:MAG: MCE family protein [Bacteroidetes bacterium]|nr:MAG: MCE family protein [Bacteroidota bacterium]